jgi:exoribonuclease R
MCSEIHVQENKRDKIREFPRSKKREKVQSFMWLAARPPARHRDKGDAPTASLHRRLTPPSTSLNPNLATTTTLLSALPPPTESDS